MKQTKKPTRNQREFLQKRGIDTSNVRVIESTKEYIKILHGDGMTIQVITKEDK